MEKESADKATTEFENSVTSEEQDSGADSKKEEAKEIATKPEVDPGDPGVEEQLEEASSKKRFVELLLDPLRRHFSDEDALVLTKIVHDGLVHLVAAHPHGAGIDLSTK